MLTPGFYWARHKHYEPRWEVVEVMVDEVPLLGVWVRLLGDDHQLHGAVFSTEYELGPKLEPPTED